MKPNKILALWFVFTAIIPIHRAVAQSFQIQSFHSPNGHAIWLVEDHSNPIITIEIVFKAGSYLDPEGLEGVGNVLGWLFNEGAGDLDAETYQGIMADESFAISADTGFEQTTVQVQFLTENKDLVMDLLKQAFEKPRFDPSAIERAKDYFEAQVLQRLNGPGQEFSDHYSPLNYGPNHPFLRYSNGDQASLAKITRADIQAAHKRTYVIRDIEVNAVGDITPEQLGLTVDSVLANLPVGKEVEERPTPQPPAENKLVVTDYAQPVTFVIGTANAISFDDEYINAARIADEILGGSGLSSRLFQTVREDAGLVYSIRSSLSAGRDFGRIGFSFQTANEDVDKALALTLEVYEEFANNGPTQEEVDQAINFITGSYPLRFQTSQDIVGYMNNLRVLGLPPEFPTIRNQQYKDVTLDDVKRVAKRLYGNPNFLMGMIGRPEGRNSGVYDLDDDNDAPR